VHVVELDAELEMLLDDVLDRDSAEDRHTARPLVVGQQRRRVAFDLLLVKVGNSLSHRIVSLSSAS
jgi:hypothetical protein